MKTMKNLLLVSLVTLASISQVNAETEVDALIEKASIAREQATQLGFEWTATAGLIKSAKEANSKGKTELAIILAKRALKQAENGIKQAAFSDKHWQDNLPN